MGERGIEAAVIAEFLRQERQRRPEVQIPLELPLPLFPYWPEQGTEKEKEDDKQRGVTIIPLYDDDDEEEEGAVRIPLDSRE